MLVFSSALFAEEHTEIGEIKKSDKPNQEFMQCKLLKGVIQSEKITNIDMCTYGLDGCDKSQKDWKSQRMYCINKSKYECYKKDLWTKENPTMTGFEKRDYPYVASSPKTIKGQTYTEVCAYW